MPVTLRSGDLQTLLRIRQTTLSLWFRHGVIPGYLVGHSWFAFRAEVRVWMESTANGPVAPRPRDPDPLDAYGDILSVDEVAQLLRMSRQAITGWIRADLMPGVRDGRRWTVEKGALRELLRECSNQVAGHSVELDG
ncbi:MAG: helix-turn-helix domain-containing protein [Clavibacter sp.]|uniref:Uncharacterized protein n=2 Tax=Microbacteriaceae TaxID=85023 RepID=B0RJ67_CLASE|nr:helix-turn-helix domain-containing protein [Clavibacter sp.]OQJ45304.1 DNA-binding protein [Clavibacter sepedonicus]OQJ50991.1 DNA-binding protein [Clavibacter sepedonicus]CAQ03257.1 hypothetical protein pCSL0010 [Clavibacter sepedonicus]